MNAKITNIYNDKILPKRGLKGGRGECFHITVGDKAALLDTGYKGNMLMRNIHALRLNVDEIDKVVLSHGHRDHTGGLASLLEARTVTAPLPIIAHPDALEPRSLKILLVHIPMGMPKPSKKLADRMDFQLTKNPVEVFQKLSTTGEIPIPERYEKQGIARRVFRKVDGRREWDPVIDDISLVLHAKDGLVILTGCCHAGLLNICTKATELFKRKIKAIIGGTHMIEYSKEEIKRVADLLENTYGTPELYLNHCTGEKAIEQLRTKFGSDMVHDCFVGSELVFEL